MDLPLTAESDDHRPELVLAHALAQLFWPGFSGVEVDSPPSVQQGAQRESSEDSSKYLSKQVGGELTPAAIARLSPTALAYIGDAVYELHVRSQFLFPPQRQQTYHRQVVAQVRAEQQAQTLAALEPLLTDSEKELVRRGRNSVGKRSRHSNPVAYQQATGFEALVGYLFLTDPGRLAALLATASNGDGPSQSSSSLPEMC